MGHQFATSWWRRSPSEFLIYFVHECPPLHVFLQGSFSNAYTKYILRSREMFLLSVSRSGEGGFTTFDIFLAAKPTLVIDAVESI